MPISSGDLQLYNSEFRLGILRSRASLGDWLAGWRSNDDEVEFNADRSITGWNAHLPITDDTTQHQRRLASSRHVKDGDQQNETRTPSTSWTTFLDVSSCCFSVKINSSIIIRINCFHVAQIWNTSTKPTPNTTQKNSANENQEYRTQKVKKKLKNKEHLKF